MWVLMLRFGWVLWPVVVAANLRLERESGGGFAMGVVVGFNVAVGLLWIFRIWVLLDDLGFVAMGLAGFCGRWWFLVVWW